ncbi:MAG TPA: hypothetical protein GXX69_03615 [Firmicutes bacterium]|nr:hypothetical protein [Bacillota bacterium]
MTEGMRTWIEVIFNIVYLILVWGLVVTMYRRQDALAPGSRQVGQLFMWAFGLLALGDTGHVGLRVLAYALGGLEKNALLIGVGAFMTSVTVTVFYVIMLFIWKARYHKPYGWFGRFLMAMAAVRLLILLHPANDWSAINPPRDWVLYRNLPLLIQGIGVVILMWIDSTANRDRFMKNVALLILVSYACYTPVILFYHINPLIGLLMIPKTVVYLVIAVLAYRHMFTGTAVS